MGLEIWLSIGMGSIMFALTEVPVLGLFKKLLRSANTGEFTTERGVPSRDTAGRRHSEVFFSERLNER
jgi:hypothetical protein